MNITIPTLLKKGKHYHALSKQWWNGPNSCKMVTLQAKIYHTYMIPHLGNQHWFIIKCIQYVIVIPFIS